LGFRSSSTHAAAWPSGCCAGHRLWIDQLN
jgi:hypothetical protein